MFERRRTSGDLSSPHMLNRITFMVIIIIIIIFCFIACIMNTHVSQSFLIHLKQPTKGKQNKRRKRGKEEEEKGEKEEEAQEEQEQDDNNDDE